jgi:predicted TIM-barrel fold metal-dependent hydrolase
VCTLSASYSAVLAIIQDYLRQFPAAIQDKILGHNAVNFYRISIQ